MNSKNIYYPLFLNASFNYRRFLKSTFKIFLIFNFLFIFFSFAFFIFQVNSLTKDTYLLKNYENKISQLQEENNVLEINFSKSNSLSNLEGRFDNQIFERIAEKEIKYIPISTIPMAEK